MQEIKEMLVQSLGQEDPLQEEMATHSSILTWKLPWTGETSGLQSMGSPGVGHNGASEHACKLSQRKTNTVFAK